MGGVTDILMIMLLLAGGYVLLKSGKLEELTSGNFQLPALPGLPAPSTPRGGGGDGGGAGGPMEGGGGGGGGGTASTGVGDCGKTIYAATGQVKDNSKRTKSGTRHYASGKPDDVTQEWGTSVNFKNYEFTCYVTITKIDHDDTVSMKFGGTHMGSGWYDCGIGFNNGQGCLGKEENHPSTDLCVVKGQSIGNIVNKKIGMKCIIVGAGSNAAEIELWADPTANGQWKQLCPRTKGVGGFFPSSSEQECTIRIDAAPGITMHCSSVNEISGWSKGAGGGGGGAPAPTPPAAPAESTGGAGGGDSESNYTNVYHHNYYVGKTRYY